MYCSIKFLGGFVVFLILLSALVGSLLPLFTSYRTGAQQFAVYGNAISAGFLISTAIVHLYPEAYESLHERLPKFRVAGLLVMFGIVSAFTIENFAKTKLENSTSVNEASYLQNAITAIVLTVSLSFHSFMEGLALGTAFTNRKKLFAISVAILGHKFFAALTLGNSLARAVDGTSVKSKGSAIVAAISFSLITPIGAFIGVVLVENLPNTQDSIFVSMLDSVSAGIFLYIGLVEILANEFREDSHNHSTNTEGPYGSISRPSSTDFANDIDIEEQLNSNFILNNPLSNSDLLNRKTTTFVIAAFLMSLLASMT